MNSLKNVFLVAWLPVLLAVLCGSTDAQAVNWTRASGTLNMTYFESNLGETIDDIDPNNRRIVIRANIRDRSSSGGIRTTCRTNRATKQRVCNSSYYYEVVGNGSCLYETTSIFNNYTSSSRRLQTYYEVTVTCPSGYAAYLQYSGIITRR